MEVEAANPNLFVSAENPLFKNHFAGSMVIEVVVNDPNLRDTDKGRGAPNVTVNGKTLRMTQASDGQWYAYFANKDKAKTADQISFNGGISGVGLDFGVFCGSNTASSVLGVSFSTTEGVAIPHNSGITGATNGESSFNTCTGSATPGASVNNVVRSPPSLNTNSNVPVGQIGINPNAWPVIQLFSFNDDVVIEYQRGGGPQRVELTYDEISEITLNLDRTRYPNNAEVFVTINDIQLNQDPTTRDSWTFSIGSKTATFYQAFTESGSNSANGNSGLVNLIPHLSKLGFDKNGKLTLTLGSVGVLQTNDRQPISSATDGTTTYNQIVTFVESQPNTGIFESFDDSDKSVFRISANAPRGQSAVIQYNDKSTSIIAGPTTASLSLNPGGGQFNPGQKATVTIVDMDQNINSGQRDDLDVFRSSATIPALKIGNPLTLEGASTVRFYPSSSSNLVTGGTVAPSAVPDKNSDRLIIDTGTATFPAPFNFEMMSLDLGISASELKELFIDTSVVDNTGTNWINFDLRSLQQQLEINDFSKTKMAFYFGLTDPSPITIVDAGDISTPQKLLQIDNSDISAINSKSGNVFLVIDFDSLNSGIGGTISGESDKQPIVIDLFSFGQKQGNEINNAIYRFELEETATNSGQFSGAIEYSVTNQLNMIDPNLIKSLRTIGDEVRFLITDRLLDEEGINIAYSDLAEVGLNISTSAKTDVTTHSGKVQMSATSFRFGQPVTVRLVEPDLNQNSDLLDVYPVVDDPQSPNVDTVGDNSGGILLEIKIKDIRYKRCTINGVEHGGLAATGFSLVETGVNTGVFEGVFKIPTQICDKTGTKLITPAGGSIEAIYHDFRDEFGESNIFSASSGGQSTQSFTTPKLNQQKLVLPKYKQTTDVILSGKLGNYKQGTQIDVMLIGPDDSSKKFGVFATKAGEYKAIITLQHNSLPGDYHLNVSYLGKNIGTTSFSVIESQIPAWIKNNAEWWSSNQISDSEFIEGIEHLVTEKIIVIPESTGSSQKTQEIPDWIKNTARWWSDGSVSDDEFIAALEFLVKNSIIRI